MAVDQFKGQVAGQGVIRSSFNQQNRTVRILAESIGQHAARAARADNNHVMHSKPLSALCPRGLLCESTGLLKRKKNAPSGALKIRFGARVLAPMLAVRSSELVHGVVFAAG